MAEHTRECLHRFEAAESVRATFRKRWPNACATCAARGCWETSDLVTGKRISEVCPECLALNLCPRCGAALFCAEPPECGACGWTLDSPGEPSYPGCICPKRPFLFEEQEDPSNG